jgi:hypothetical protein
MQELVQKICQQLNLKPEQVQGLLGTLFQMANKYLTPEQMTKINSVLPGIQNAVAGLAQTPSSGMGGMIGGVLSAIGMKSLGDMSQIAGKLKSLGIEPQHITNAVPTVTQFLKDKGQGDLANQIEGIAKKFSV